MKPAKYALPLPKADSTSKHFKEKALSHSCDALKDSGYWKDGEAPAEGEQTQ